MTTPKTTHTRILHRVLLVDDDPEVAKTICCFFRKNGLQIKSCKSVEEGYRAFLDKKYDVVVTDISFENSSGIDLIKQIRRTDKQIPILITSGSGSYIRHEIDPLLFDDLLPKPLYAEELLNKLKRLLPERAKS